MLEESSFDTSMARLIDSWLSEVGQARTCIIMKQEVKQASKSVDRFGVWVCLQAGCNLAEWVQQKKRQKIT